MCQDDIKDIFILEFQSLLNRTIKGYRLPRREGIRKLSEELQTSEKNINNWLGNITKPESHMFAWVCYKLGAHLVTDDYHGLHIASKQSSESLIDSLNLYGLKVAKGKGVGNEKETIS